jgi:hypothetical protein
MNPKILVVIPSKRGVTEEFMESLENQTVKPSRIIVENGCLNDEIQRRFTVGERVAYILNKALSRVDLGIYDFLVRFDDDLEPLPPDFLERNLTVDFDLMGKGGRCLIIRVEPFLERFNGRFPVVNGEDSYIIYDFNFTGLRIADYVVKPHLKHVEGHGPRYYFECGEARYRFGYFPLYLAMGFYDTIGNEKVNLKNIYVIMGYITAYLKQVPKHWFHNQVTAKQRVFDGWLNYDR